MVRRACGEERGHQTQYQGHDGYFYCGRVKFARPVPVVKGMTGDAGMEAGRQSAAKVGQAQGVWLRNGRAIGYDLQLPSQHSRR